MKGVLHTKLDALPARILSYFNNSALASAGRCEVMFFKEAIKFSMPRYVFDVRDDLALMSAAVNIRHTHINTMPMNRALSTAVDEPITRDDVI